MYGVETKELKRAVRRNAVRFPEDFMFVLNGDELADLRRQIGTSSSWGGLRYPPMAFTEQGVAMLSSVLNRLCPVHNLVDFHWRVLKESSMLLLTCFARIKSTVSLYKWREAWCQFAIKREEKSKFSAQRLL